MEVDSRLEVKTDEDLMCLLSNTHSHAAFAALVRRHASQFRRVAFRYTGIREEAEDIVQNAFLKIWNRPHLWKTEQQVKFTTWFYRVVVNECLDFQRKHKPVAIMEGEEFEDTFPLADTVLADRQQQQRVERAFRELPLNMQASLNLSFYEPVPNEEAAQIMGLSVKAFQSLLMRAKKMLKDKVMAEDNTKARRYGSQ